VPLALRPVTSDAQVPRRTRRSAGLGGRATQRRRDAWRGRCFISRIEQALVERWPGATIIKASAGLGLAGVLPLVLYVLIGPADGNPIGLGILAFVTLPVAAVGMAVGVIRLIVERLGSRGD
jgi:hypothetical protein